MLFATAHLKESRLTSSIFTANAKWVAKQGVQTEWRLPNDLISIPVWRAQLLQSLMKSFVPSLIEDSIDWDYSMHISELNKWNGSKTGPTNVKSDLTVWWSQPGLWTGHHPHPSSPVISEARSGSWSTAPNFVWSGKHFASTSPSQHTFFWKWHKQSTPKCLGAYVEQSQQSLKYGARYSACCQLSAWSASLSQLQLLTSWLQRRMGNFSVMQVLPESQIWSFLDLHFKSHHPAWVLPAAVISPPTLTPHST